MPCMLQAVYTTSEGHDKKPGCTEYNAYTMQCIHCLKQQVYAKQQQHTVHALTKIA